MSGNTKIWTALVTVYVLWGSTYLGIAIAGETIPPLFAVSTRFIAAGSLMALLVKLRGGSLRISARSLVSCVAIGALLPGANAVLFFAERHVATGLASLLIASVPLWLVLLRVAGRERLPWQALLGVGIGFAGVAVLAHPSGGAKVTGIALCIVSAVMWSVGSLLSARVPMPDDPFVATTYEMLAGGLLLFVPSLFTVHHFSPSAGSIAGWVYLVTFGSVVGYTAYVWLLASAPIGLVATYAYVNPVVAIALGVLFRGERLTWTLGIGAVVVVSAVALVVRQESTDVPDEPGGPEPPRRSEADVVGLDRHPGQLATGRGAEC